MRIPPTATAVVGTAALAAALSACGASGAHRDDAVRGPALTVYAGAPLRGIDRPAAIDVVDGERLALAESRGRVGRWRVRLRVLDDSGLATGRWDPARVSDNAARAVRDSTTIAYLGGANSGATAIALPLLNQAGILLVSPGGAAAALTRRDRAVPGSPDRYYPNRDTGRTFGRVIPPDSAEGAALAVWMARLGVRSVYLVDAQEADGVSVAAALRRRLPAAGIRVAGSESVAPDESDWRDVVAGAGDSGADTLFFAGSAQAGAAALLRAVRDRAPGLRVFGASALAQPAVAARLGPGGEGLRVTSAALPAWRQPRAAARFRAAFRHAYGRAPQPSAAFGYEGMHVVLDAIRRARADGNRRSAVVRAFFATERRDSPLGRYVIDRRGDPVPGTYAGYVVHDRRLVPRTRATGGGAP